MSNDPYSKLKPRAPTPPEELCRCSGRPPFLLRYGLSSNPIACTSCNLELRPEATGLTRALADEAGYWNAFYETFYFLWLDSGEFESWAKAELSNPTSRVNARGRELRAGLEAVRRCYYWWFQDTGADDFVPLESCPICGRHLAAFDTWLVCESCSVVVAN